VTAAPLIALMAAVGNFKVIQPKRAKRRTFGHGFAGINES